MNLTLLIWKSILYNHYSNEISKSVNYIWIINQPEYKYKNLFILYSKPKDLKFNCVYIIIKIISADNSWITQKTVYLQEN